MPITTKQIAELAGVSRGTVDRALNGRPGVSGENRRRIQEIADSLGYVPNRAGKALSAARKQMVIGLVLNCTDNPFFDDVISGMESCKSANPDFNIEFRYRRLKGYSALEQVDAIGKLGEVTAVLITPLNDVTVSAKINSLCENGIHVITINNDIMESKRLLHVGCDYYGSGRTTAGLLGLMTGGRGEVGIVTGSFGMLGHKLRIDGFQSVLAEKYPQINCPWIIECGDDDDRAYEAVKRQLAKNMEVTAVYFGAAGISGGVKAITEVMGENMPMIITCDDIPQTKELIKERIIAATVCQEPFRQGYEAVRLALEYHITGKKPENDILFMKNEIKIFENI